MADKKLFQLELGTPTDSDLIAYGKSGSNYKNITVADFRTVMAGEGGLLTTLVYELGDWDMTYLPVDSVLLQEPPVPPDIFGVIIEPNQVRSTSVMIRNDANTAWYDLGTQLGGNSASPSSISISKSWLIPTWTLLFVNIVQGGFFDQAGFSSTGFNRGYVTITYVPT